jgi:predicted alpha/beta superfamily hydrolase
MSYSSLTIRSHKFILSLFIIILSTATSGNAQDTVLTVTYKGSFDSLQSRILHQKRYVQVYTPPSYKPGSSQKYDVLYVLDGGNWNTSLITQIQRFIEAQGQMPPTIIVSVMGIDRNIELTPTHLDSWQAPTGGADNFLGFLKDELIPYINTNYPSDGDNTLWGHSLGGMFVVYALLKEPNTFKSYIAVDPSLWWDNILVPKLAAAKLPTLSDSTITLFISGRQGPGFHEMRIDSMEAILKLTAPKTLTWNIARYKDETHSSIRLKSTYEGLKFTYAGHSGTIEFIPMGGIVVKDKPFKLWYFDDTSKVHYTLDGTVPTSSSADAQREISLDGPAHVTFKRIMNRSRYDKTVSGDFIDGKTLKTISKPKNAKGGGLHYVYYEGNKDQLRDIKNIKPVQTGTINKDFDFKKLGSKSDYFLLADGTLEVKEEGYYVFYFKAGTGSKLFLGNNLLLQWKEFEHREVLTYIVPLTKGFYPVRLEYFNKKEEAVLPLYYITPSIMAGMDPVPVPAELEYSKTD